MYTLIEGNTIPLSQINLDKLKPDEREKLFKKLGRQVRKWHEKNFYHGELAPRNILVKIKPNPTFTAVDLERALSNPSKENLQRDLNFFKHELVVKKVGNEQDWENFYHGYSANRKQ